MKIKKVKYNGSRVVIEYEVERPTGDPDKYTLDSSDTPAPEFKNAFLGLRAPLLNECELHEVDVQKVVVRGVSYSHYDDGRIGAVITALIELEYSNSPLVLNSPHKPDDGSFDGDDKVLFTETLDAITELSAAAEAYIRGERAQMALDFGPDKAA